jgi:hypothetical protein
MAVGVEVGGVLGGGGGCGRSGEDITVGRGGWAAPVPSPGTAPKAMRAEVRWSVFNNV